MSSGAGVSTLAAILDAVLGGALLDVTDYIALYTTMPDAAGAGGVECAVGGYARLGVTNSVPNWSNATIAGGTATKANALRFTWPASLTADLLGVVGGAIMSAAIGGTQRIRFEFLVAGVPTAKNFYAGDIPFVEAGAITWAMS